VRCRTYTGGTGDDTLGGEILEKVLSENFPITLDVGRSRTDGRTLNLIVTLAMMVTGTECLRDGSRSDRKIPPGAGRGDGNHTLLRS
jgi:hypothetical protein